MTDDLTDLPGVGAKTAKNLKRAGFDTKEKISKANVRRLSRINGIGSKGAKKIIEAAGGTVITTRKKTKEEQMQDMYGETFERIESLGPGQIREEILSEESEGTTTRGSLTEGVREFRDDERIESPFRVSVVGPRKRSVEKVHENRSERAQDVDEQQNAPITTDEEKWLQNPNRYDYPGVDTIPETRQKRRAERAAQVAQERGAVDRVEQKGSAKNLQGKFSPEGTSTYGREDDVVRVQGNATEPERTLAHEVGHALDYGFGEGRGYDLTNELFDLDTPTSEGQTEELTEQAKTVSKKARGDFKGQQQYRRQFKELTADALGQAIIQPRATKRDAPNLFERIEDAAEEAGFGEAIPDPLGTEPEPQGFLE